MIDPSRTRAFYFEAFINGHLDQATSFLKKNELVYEYNTNQVIRDITGGLFFVPVNGLVRGLVQFKDRLGTTPYVESAAKAGVTIQFLQPVDIDNKNLGSSISEQRISKRSAFKMVIYRPDARKYLLVHGAAGEVLLEEADKMFQQCNSTEDMDVETADSSAMKKSKGKLFRLEQIITITKIK